MKNTKQVIVWRNDLKVRTGKKMAMAAHASMAFLTKDGEMKDEIFSMAFGDERYQFFTNETLDMHRHYDEIKHWLENSFRKIVCYVNSEEEFDSIHQKALDNGLISHIVIDNGATEFNGVLTKTCLAIGPHYDERFIGISDHLPLL